jgi:hypothetical protein
LSPPKKGAVALVCRKPRLCGLMRRFCIFGGFLLIVRMFGFDGTKVPPALFTDALQKAGNSVSLKKTEFD